MVHRSRLYTLVNTRYQGSHQPAALLLLLLRSAGAAGSHARSSFRRTWIGLPWIGSFHPPGQPPPRWWSNPPVLLLPRWLVALSLDMALAIVRTLAASVALALWQPGFQPLQLPLLSTAMSSVLVLLSSLHASSRENRHRSTAEGVNPAHHRDSHVMFRACR